MAKATTTKTTMDVTTQQDAGALNDADALLVDGICALEDYVNEHERACEKLKQGFFKLTMARQHLPAHALSDLSYHEFFDAATVVAARGEDEHPSDLDDDDNGDDDGDSNDSDAPSDVHWHLTTPNSERAIAANDASNASTLTQRKRSAKSSGKPSSAPAQGAPLSAQQQLERQNAAILWFSSLPPSDLRQAQKHFRSALQALLYAATSASKVQRSVSGSALQHA